MGNSRPSFRNSEFLQSALSLSLSQLPDPGNYVHSPASRCGGGNSGLSAKSGLPEIEGSGFFILGSRVRVIFDFFSGSRSISLSTLEDFKNSLAPVHPAKTQLLESDTVSDLTSILSSSSVTATPYKHISIETPYTDKSEMDSLKMGGSVEAEVVLKHLREARVQVSKSKDVGPSKNVVEALINIIIEEFRGSVYEEDEWLDKLLSSKLNQVFLICIMVLFSLLMVWFLSSSSNGSFTRPKPT
ncbi:uncharacterized protein LOC131019854 isoform X1 [Salvia miltiorrhiza]|uniref:uncharacterized protein LOC131019854 isoform X1 n=1 Tax=Salvia miltiorrhiza TaxID=226208 RepID=UPI0025AC03F6|nr:uncharacterized protein LOC131019854 isoform X1 [Salvia miltiorrhiza]